MTLDLVTLHAFVMHSLTVRVRDGLSNVHRAHVHMRPHHVGGSTTRRLS